MLIKNRHWKLLTYQQRLQMIPEIKYRFMFLLRTAKPQSLFEKYRDRLNKLTHSKRKDRN